MALIAAHTDLVRGKLEITGLLSICVESSCEKAKKDGVGTELFTYTHLFFLFCI